MNWLIDLIQDLFSSQNKDQTRTQNKFNQKAEEKRQENYNDEDDDDDDWWPNSATF